MKSIKRTSLIALAVVTILSCLIFGCFINKIYSVQASAFSNSALELKLTGYNGYTPLSYFDKIEQSKIVDNKDYYYNYKNQKTNQYYIVDANVTNLFGAYSTGTSEFAPFGEYLTLANNNVLYAYARTGIVTESGAKNTVTISLKHNGNTVSQYNTRLGSVNSSDVYLPYYYKTNAIKISADKNITFSYTNNDKSSLLSPAQFKLFEPSVVLKTIIDNVTISNTNVTVQHGGVVKLDATNAVMDISSSTPLVSYFKEKHKIEYEIIQGGEIAYVVGNYLYFEGQNSGLVKIRAKSLKDSESNQYVYSDTVTFNYVSQKSDVITNQNFANSANIIGQGEYYVGENVTLIASMNPGYNFVYWEVNGEKKYTKNISFECTENNDIKLFSTKNVSIAKINIKDKTYDGNTSAEILNVEIDGLLSTHDVYLSDFYASYYSSSVGTKILNISDIPVLEGIDSKWYVLSSVIPNIYGNILPKPSTLRILPSQKTYGEGDPVYQVEISGLIGIDNLDYQINREQNENVGSYLLSATANNPNYNVSVIENYLTINKKQLSIQNKLITKEYDKTTIINIQPNLIGIAFNDNISATIYANFNSSNAGTNIPLIIDRIVLTGTHKNNYTLLSSAIPFANGNITRKTAVVTIQNTSKQYGAEDPTYIYSISGVLTGDILGGRITRTSGENVGTYDVKYEGNNSNYIVQSNTAKLDITKRPATVYAFASEKTYGDTDPIFTYLTSGLLPGDYLSGSMVRSSGENAGKYNISLGTLKNDNYELQFFGNELTIKEMELQGEVSFNSKVYDGTLSLNGYTCNFTNLISTDTVQVTIVGHLQSKDVGNSINVIIDQIDLNNPNYILNIDDKYISITRRTVDLIPDEKSKVYGQNDEDITYQAQNIVDGETLNGELVRSEGEIVGSYQICQGSITNENNPNYNIIFHNTSSYLIIKKPLIVHSVSQTKYYGDVDPICLFELVVGCLEFDDVIADIITGTPGRQEGEMPGVYSYTTGTVRTQSINYDVVYTPSGSLTIMKLNVNVYANACSKIFGDNDPEFSYFSNDADINTLNLNLTRTQGENVGYYAITYTTLFHNIYNITFIENQLTILPRHIVLKADNKIKYYGDIDPKLTCSVLSGMLCYGNKLEDIITGDLVRIEGESIGNYSISKGSLNIVANYEFDFVQGDLNILKQNIVVKAVDVSKNYKSTDPALTFEIITGKLVMEDVFIGNIEREVGENSGEYTINQGSLSLNDNYDLHYVCGVFTIQKAYIKIKIYDLYKQYGDTDPNFEYEIIEGELHSGESLIGSISRANGENIGLYNINADFYNPNYVIEYDLGIFNITKRIIKIVARSYTITYNENIPALEYDIIQGSILSIDTLSGGIYKVSGFDAGIYDINSTLNLGRNYKIEFTKGKFTILPISISLSSIGAVKTYGQSDPFIPYFVSQGTILNGDDLQGFVTRDTGEDVGEYHLVPSFANINYKVEISSGKFRILPKNINLYATVMDKIYDEKTNAFIVHPTLSGLIDQGISISYENENCANFENNEVGNNKNVFLHDVFLTGQKAYNYNLI
ncbi:MAG: MBG domain-containing protein, partial [Clostridia bacterium]|nr:MBG domain-containing protein [Clostridia bacterium]